MTKEELKKEAQEQVNYCTPLYPESFIQGYLAGAEPRENKIADIKANCDLAIEGRDIKIKELEEVCQDLSDKFDYQVKQVMKLEQQIEKMKCCENCKGVCDSDDVAYFCKNNNYKLWEIEK